MNYTELHKVWKKEEESDELQSLDKKFYSEIHNYLREKKELYQINNETLKTNLKIKETENIQKFFVGLVYKRYNKILKKAINKEKIELTTLTYEEENIYGEILSTLKNVEKIINDVLKIEIENMSDEKPKRILIRFLQGITAIVGSDMKTYGPFKKEDLASIPIENAEALIKRGVAIKVEFE